MTRTATPASAKPGWDHAAGPVLVVNTGSSSLKYRLVDPGTGAGLAHGLAERIGLPGSTLRHEVPGGHVSQSERPLPDHAAALAAMLEMFRDLGPSLDGLLAVGHRVVHGGAVFTEPTLVDDAVQAAVERLVPLAPLHNPACLLGIRELRRLLPEVPQVGVFDTAFHAGMPAYASTYAVPRDWRETHGVRKYGFHGSSYAYVTRRAAQLLGRPVHETNLVIAHLGNGASIAAVQGGRGVDTTMGLTPLPGLVMGTRSGDVDPAVITHLGRVAGLDATEVDRQLNTGSGLLGLAGASDMRAVRSAADAGDPDAILALQVYAYRIRCYLGAYLAAVPGVHAIVFTAGIGENDPRLRADVCDPLAHLGITLRAEHNDGPRGEDRAIDDGSGAIRVLVVRTDEEAEIAREAASVVRRA